MKKLTLMALCTALGLIAVPSSAQEEVIGEGRRVTGLVGVLVADAEAEVNMVEVDSVERVDVNDWVLLRTPDGAIQEVHCVEATDAAESTVFLGNSTVAAFPTGTQVIQGETVGQALTEGEAVNRTEGCEEPGAAWWKSTAFLIGAGAAGIVVLNDALDDGDTFQDVQEPASTFQP